MDYIVNGGNKLYGELQVYGSKNCTLALLGATLLTEECVTLHNCPVITDVENMLKLLAALGKDVCRCGNTVSVAGYASTIVPAGLAKLLRGSGLVLGSAVARYNYVFLPATGGCAIGSRPIDIHLDGLRAMQVEVTDNAEGVTCRGKPNACEYRLRFPSVGATENLLCAATLAKGKTTLVNCALEPEVVALQNLLCKMGAKIEGVGSSVVTVCGVEKLHGAEFDVIPDRIVAATYLACAAAAGGKVTVVDCVSEHITALLEILQPRYELRLYKNVVTIKSDAAPQDFGNIITAPYPAFPTDVQQIMLSLCAASNGGTSVITEKLFENRLLHNVAELRKMGANISVRENVAEIVGNRLHGAEVQAADLRGGAGLVVAALATEGLTCISKAQHIERGYSQLAENLNSVGAEIFVQP